MKKFFTFLLYVLIIALIAAVVFGVGMLLQRPLQESAIALGVILGIGQFIVVGYFFGAYLPKIVEYAERYGTTFFSLLLVSLGLAAWYWWARRRAQAVSGQ